MTDFERAVAQVRAECLKTCPALLCEQEQACKALLYDTPGFYSRVQTILAITKAENK